MDPLLLRIFQTQVLLQCKFAMTAVREINTGLKRDINTGVKSGAPDPEHVFYGVQNFLVASANIGKALWGGGGKFEAARKPLRDSIGVSESSPLKEVQMRHNFEHIDDRIVRWWNTSKTRTFVDLAVGTPDHVKGAPEGEMFRFFDPYTTDVVFWGQKFNVQQIADEVNRMMPKLREEAAKPHWSASLPEPKA